MTILVTGGAGYIGSHVCHALRQEGFSPLVYDSMEQGHPWAIRWGPSVRGSLLNTKQLEAVLYEHNPIGVIHLASYINVRESVQDPLKYYENNCLGTLSLLQAMSRCGLSTLVFSSSAAVYGIPSSLPIHESHPKLPTSPYGKSKWFAEQMLDDFPHIHTMALRYFNAAGADLEGKIGEDHYPETHLIPLAIGAAWGTYPPLTLFGTDHATPDGTPIRDYVHVADLARAHVLALRWLLKNKKSLALNLGSGEGHSVAELLTTLESILGRSIPRRIGPRFLCDPPILLADISEARNLLQWEPRQSALPTILESAVRWHESISLFPHTL